MTPQIVAYLDVMAFKELVEGEKNIERLQIYFQTIEEELKNQTGPGSEIEIKHIIFSDTVVLATPYKDGNVEHFCKFLKCVRDIQFRLAKEGIWLRGGLAIDDLYFEPTQNRIAGPGLNKAYQLERLASFFRVILDPQIVTKFKTTRGRFLNLINDREGKPTSDGSLIFSDKSPGISQFPQDTIFIDYLAHFQWASLSEVEAVYDHMRAACYSKQEHYLKYRWLVDYAVRTSFKISLPERNFCYSFLDL